ncbi:MAG: malonyl-ACP O-methyltransferase BioC [Betaproteobacteria bacterium]|nr:malonyl-ACP O-methyltransferase BioC [Betaproteobacteria bacterium]
MPAEPRFPAPDPREIDPSAVRRAFGRAAATYDGAAVLQREVSARLAGRLDVVKLAPGTILDAGCGTGEAIGELSARYPSARVVALDAALPMLQQARTRSAHGRSLLARMLGPLGRGGTPAPAFVCADGTALPLPGVCVDLVWSNLMLQWVNDLPRAFAEFRRVLRVGGLLTFTTFGPDTLKELARAFARIDGHTHVSRFVDMHDLGDMLVQAGFADPVMDREQITVTYPSPAALLAELKAIGATNQTRGRPRGLTGRGRRAALEDVLRKLAQDGRIPATFEVVYGHAWKGEPKRTPDGLPIVKVERRTRG